MRRLSRQRGSAYLVVLVATLVLTLTGLILSLVGQSELQIAASERAVQRVFYAADSGIAASTARALNSAEYAATTFQVYEVADPDAPPGLNLRHQVELSPFFPILDAPCNLCEVNNAGTYSEQSYRRIDHAITVIGRRVAGPGDWRLADKTLAAMIEVQPWKVAAEAYWPLSQPEELEKLKF